MFWNLNIVNTMELCASIRIALDLPVLMLFSNQKVKINILNVLLIMLYLYFGKFSAAKRNIRGFELNSDTLYIWPLNCYVYQCRELNTCF